MGGCGCCVCCVLCAVVPPVAVCEAIVFTCRMPLASANGRGRDLCMLCVVCCWLLQWPWPWSYYLCVLCCLFPPVAVAMNCALCVLRAVGFSNGRGRGRIPCALHVAGFRQWLWPRIQRVVCCVL